MQKAKSVKDIVYFSDLVPCSAIETAQMTNEERRRFLEEVDIECERRYGKGWEERLERAVGLGVDGYNPRVNC